MIKIAAIAGAIAAAVILVLLLCVPQQQEKVEQVDNALSTLGNFAENRVRTSDDVKIFNDLLKAEPQKEKSR
ncbi:hypothetical protein RYA05_04805 [Pseudomonas syringae pv. actinidiae]|nr:hypothetical protein [Pseudomonas syringae pv. actinidiae]